MLTKEYRLLRRIGRGGMGEVWEAVRVKGAHIVVPCAIKLLHADFTETARERRLFSDEARIATQLDHSCIVKVIDVGETRDGRPFLVMERVDGVDLRSLLVAAGTESLLEIDVVTYIVDKVLAALAYAHGRMVGGSDAGIVHSDVTPGNILISSSGDVLLTDFGIGRFAAAVGPVTRAVGTLRYMSPEQLSGDPRRETDIYGLGVVLHELLDGKRFLEDVPPNQISSRVLLGPPPLLTRQDVPAWLNELRARMIATDPRARPTANEARAVLAEHCSRYLAAAARLEADYARWIGRRRSGVTQLFAEGEAIEPEPGDDDKNEEIVAPTEMLPVTASRSATEVLPETASRSATSAVAEVIASKPSTARPLLIASMLMVLVLGTMVVVLLVQMFREPDDVAGLEVPPELTADERPPREREQTVTPEQAGAAEQALPVAVPTPVVEPSKPALEPTVPVPDEPDETAVEKQPEPTQATKSKSSPKPQELPAVGVVFFVESKLEGRIKAGRKIIEVKNRSGYAELPPGKYEISWQPAGSDDWQVHGKVTIGNISPSRYKVRLDDGKIVEFTKL
jgi:serine/threonine protein kinase